MDFKEEIALTLEKELENLDKDSIKKLIEKPKDKNMGDFAFPCFILAKELHKAPKMIAEELAEKINEKSSEIDFLESVSAVNGFLNFTISTKGLAKVVLDEYDLLENDYGSSDEGNGRNIVIDFSSPNIAKPFHIGHLRSTVIGWALHNIYQFLGYNVTGVNHLGDWGTQFGKLIEGYKKWGDEYDIDGNPIDELTRMYVRINKECEEDEEVLKACRDNFKKLEDGDEYCVGVWKKFSEVSLKEFNRVYDLLGIKFESICGEAFYSDKMPEVLDILEKSGKLIDSEGARIIEMRDGKAPCIIIKSNGSSTYATRDLAAIMYRARTYDFEKDLYLTSYEQILHFKQVFETAELLGLDKKYITGLKHVPFGMILLKDGKMSTREGKIIKLEELLNTAIEKAKEVIEKKNPDQENKDEIAKAVGIGAVIFNDLANSRIKDEIFDWDTMLNFNGETGPYIQYICVRTKSVIEKAGYKPERKDINLEKLTDEYSKDVLSLLYGFKATLQEVTQKEEPSILSRYLIDLAQSYSVFYNNNKIIGEEKEIQDARLYLTYVVGTVLEKGLNLLGIQVPDKM